MATRNRSRMRALAGGAISGLIGGVALWVWNGATAVRQGNLWSTFKGASMPFFDAQRVATPGFDFWPALVGSLLHLAVSAGWGVLFALMFYGLSKATTVLAGLFWGLVAWITMYYVVLPLVGLTEFVRSIPVGGAILGHLWFGLVLGLAFLPFQRRWPSAHAPGRTLRMGHDVPLTH